MDNPPDTDVRPTEPLDQTAALQILEDMAAEYRQAETHFNDVRAGLIEAARDCKIVGVRPVDIQRITGWSKTTVHANTQQPATRTPKT